MEAAFFAVPNGPREQPKTLIENNSLMFDAKKAGDASPDVESIALHGIFGYASFDDHPNWRETPEHARIIEKMGRSPLKLGNAIVPSGCIFVPDSSMFHVKFHAGI
ncbi:hypothetical protein MMC11_005146 [Xylographa trunciseda]|nr:hypothetical protein [Xylographa trunciseda]